MIELQGAPALGGYVRAVFSDRVKGYAAPVDLVRAQLKTAARVALRARMRAEFSGYLVSDADDDYLTLRRLETYGRKYEAKAAPFSSRRAWYSGSSDDLCMTVDSDPLDSRYRALTGGPLDAPGCLPGGACDSMGALFGGSPQAVALREYISDEVPAPAFSERRVYWSDFVARSGCGVTCGLSGDSKARYSVRSGFDLDSIDAPEFFAAGSVRWLDYGPGVSDGFPAKRLAMRKGWM